MQELIVQPEVLVGPQQAAPSTGLPARARALVAAYAAGGVAVLGVAALVRRSGGPYLSGTLLVLAAVVAATWIKPLVLYQDSESLAVQFDEGCLTVMLLALPGTEVLVGFLAAIVVAEAVQRRSPVKVAFNVGQMLVSVGLAIGVADLLAPQHAHLGPARVGAVAVGAVVFIASNGLAVGSILSALGGGPLRSVLVEAWRIRLLVFTGNVAVAVVSGVALNAYDWSLPLVLLLFLVFRQVLAGHFHAQHDRARARGLFEATQEVHHPLEADAVQSALESAAGSLLRGSATVRADAPGDGEHGTELRCEDGPTWLVVAGRSHNEPFDEVDRSLLEALGAVGASALTNAALYGEREQQRQRLAAITSSLAEGVCATDVAGRVTFVNPAAAALLGWAAGATGAELPDVLSTQAARCMRSARTVTSRDASLARPDGTAVPVEITCAPMVDKGEPVGAVVTFRDITERRVFEERLTHQAFHDPLTGLPNRRVFLDRLEHAIRRSERDGDVHAVLFADVDRFKLTNDSLGHQAGDDLLRAIAERIRSTMRPGDTLARFGGDEFSVLVEGIDGIGEAVAVAERITGALAGPIRLGESHEVVASVSVGIALTSGRASPDDVIHDADVAMYEAKGRGPGRYEVFDRAAMGDRSMERIRTEAALRQALEQGELEVYYQPLAASDTCEVIGAEALVRWNHPTEGLLGPDRFIAVAEDTGLIFPLGRFVLEEACRQAVRWRATSGHSDFAISVNLSTRQFQDGGLVDDVANILALTGLPPAQLSLEITEHLAVRDIERANSTMYRLKDLGVRLAIDDFGTGYSSLSYLKRIPVDTVKVDRAFVQDLQASGVDTAIVTAVIGLAGAVGMTTVAEGVESEAQLHQLRLLGCPVVQGFLIGRPVPAVELTARLLGIGTGLPS